MSKVEAPVDKQSPSNPAKKKLDFGFLISGAWVGAFVLCIVFSIACWFLGQWQMDRRMEALEEINKVVENYDIEPVAFQEHPDLFTDFQDQDKWTPVKMQGRYLPEDTLIARNRPLAGRPGYEVLVPFELDNGQRIVVDRGWLPIGDTPGWPDEIPAPPADKVSIIVRAVGGEPTLEDRSAPEGQVASIDLVEIQQTLGYPIATAGYGVMAAEAPEPVNQPSPLAEPTIDEGPHLSYSMQWFTFGLMSFLVWGYMARQRAIQNREDELLGETEESGFISAQRIRRPKPVKRRRSGEATDEEIEDAFGDY